MTRLNVVHDDRRLTVIVASKRDDDARKDKERKREREIAEDGSLEVNGETR